MVFTSSLKMLPIIVKIKKRNNGLWLRKYFWKSLLRLPKNIAYGCDFIFHDEFLQTFSLLSDTA